MPDKTPGNPANSPTEDFPGFPGRAQAEPMPISALAREVVPPAPEPPLLDRPAAEPWSQASAAPPDSDEPVGLSPKWDVFRRDAARFWGSRAARERVLEEIRRRDLQVSGVIAPGPRVEIDRCLLPHLILDLDNDRARTADGLIRWQAVAVATRVAAQVAARALPADPVRTSPAVRIPSRQIDFLKWYGAAYPDGHPAGKKLETLAHEAAGALACRISTRTIRRALTERDVTRRGPRTKAAR